MLMIQFYGNLAKISNDWVTVKGGGGLLFLEVDALFCAGFGIPVKSLAFHPPTKISKL